MRNAVLQRLPYIGSTWAASPGKLRPTQDDKIQIPLFFPPINEADVCNDISELKLESTAPIML